MFIVLYCIVSVVGTIYLIFRIPAEAAVKGFKKTGLWRWWNNLPNHIGNGPWL